MMLTAQEAAAQLTEHGLRVEVDANFIYVRTAPNSHPDRIANRGGLFSARRVQQMVNKHRRQQP